MSLLSSAVDIANKVTKSLGLQTTVTWEPAVSDGYGSKTYDTAQPLLAVVSWNKRNVLARNGEWAACKATVTFLDPTVVIAFDDRITLPNGSTGPILTMSGPMDTSSDASTRPLLTEITVG